MSRSDVMWYDVFLCDVLFAVVCVCVCVWVGVWGCVCVCVYVWCSLEMCGVNIDCYEE